MTKLTGQAKNIIPGKFVAIPGKDKAAFGGANAFKANPKSIGLTKSLVVKAGISLGAASLVVGAVGSYPFARFEMAEATDKLGIAMFQASKNGDEEEVIRLSNLLDEMLDTNAWEKIIALIPYANVYQAASKNIQQAIVSANSFKEQAEKELAKKETERIRLEEQGESDFSKERRESDEAAFERKREFGEEESERFEGIDEERQAAKERETRILQEVFRLRRAGKFDEADELELTIFQ